MGQTNNISQFLEELSDNSFMKWHDWMERWIKWELVGWKDVMTDKTEIKLGFREDMGLRGGV